MNVLDLRLTPMTLQEPPPTIDFNIGGAAQFYNTTNAGVLTGFTQFFMSWIVTYPSSNGYFFYLAQATNNGHAFLDFHVVGGLPIIAINLNNGNLIQSEFSANILTAGSLTLITVTVDTTAQTMVVTQDGVSLSVKDSTGWLESPGMLIDSDPTTRYQWVAFIANPNASQCAGDFRFYINSTQPVGTPIFWLTISSSDPASVWESNTGGSGGPLTPQYPSVMCGGAPSPPHWDITSKSSAAGEGGIGDLWMDQRYVDFSNAATRRKFINADKSWIDLGYFGEKPLGTSPRVWNTVHTGNSPDEFINGYGQKGDSNPWIVIANGIDPTTGQPYPEDISFDDCITPPSPQPVMMLL